MKVDSTYRIN